MHRPTAEAILSHHKKLMKWDQPFMFQMTDVIIDLSPAIGKAAHTPLDARNQPAHYLNDAYIGSGVAQSIQDQLIKPNLWANIFASLGRHGNPVPVWHLPWEKD